MAVTCSPQELNALILLFWVSSGETGWYCQMVQQAVMELVVGQEVALYK